MTSKKKKKITKPYDRFEKRLRKRTAKLAFERKRVETALIDSETRYRRLFESAQDGILILNAETGQITDVNPFLIKMLGYSHKEFLGKKLWEVGLFKDVIPSRASFKKLQTKGYIRYENLPLETKDGRKMAVEFVSNVYLVNHSKVIQCNIRDITDRKIAQEALQKVHSELESKVNQRTSELRQVNIKLSQEIEERKKAEGKLLNTRRLSDIGTLAATVAHELRNPLAAIRMAAYNIKRKAKNPELDKNLKNIEIKINDSEKIISNLLFYSRLKKAVFEQVDIYKTLEEYLVNAKAQYSKQSLKIHKQMEAIKGITIKADRLQMQELFGNILNNAYEASPETGGEIEVVGSVHGTNFIKITIKDNGIGIGENDLKRLFEPFFSTKAKGTGLGLTVCYQIIKLHGGKIDVQSRKGKGTSVSMILPIKREKNV